jgi:hypothetical protein
LQRGPSNRERQRSKGGGSVAHYFGGLLLALGAVEHGQQVRGAVDGAALVGLQEVVQSLQLKMPYTRVKSLARRQDIKKQWVKGEAPLPQQINEY